MTKPTEPLMPEIFTHPDEGQDFIDGIGSGYGSTGSDVDPMALHAYDKPAVDQP